MPTHHTRPNVVKLRVEYEGRDPRVDPWLQDIIAFGSVQYEVAEVRQQAGPTAAYFIYGSTDIAATHVKMSDRSRVMTIAEYRRWASASTVVRAVRPTDPEPQEVRAGMIWHDRTAQLQRWPWGEVSYVKGSYTADDPARLTITCNGESVTFKGTPAMLEPMAIAMLHAGLRAGARMDREAAARFANADDGTIPLHPR